MLCSQSLYGEGRGRWGLEGERDFGVGGGKGKGGEEEGRGRQFIIIGIKNIFKSLVTRGRIMVKIKIKTFENV